jgi:similar to spore coat protein
MDQQSITPHETMQLHELLTFKNICLTKSVTMSPLVSDKELKAILQNDVSISKQHIQELSGLMEHSGIVVDKRVNF